MASQVFPLLMAPKLPAAPFKRFKPSETFQAGSWRCQLCNKPSLSFSTGPKLPDAPFKRSKPSETSNPALGGATQPAKPCLGAAKLWAVGSLSTCFLQELPNYMGCDKPSLFFSTGPQLPNAPENAGCFLQTVQTFRNLPNRLLELQNYGLKLPDFPFKASKPSKTCQTVSWSCQLPAVASQVFSFLFGRNCRMFPSNASNPPKLPTRLLELPRNLPNRLLELPNYGLWQAKSFLFYRPEIAGCSRQTLQTLRNFQTG